MSLAPLSSVASFATNAVTSGIQKITAGLSFANVLSRMPAPSTPPADPPRAAVRADDLRKRLDDALKQFRDAVQRRFSSARIDTTVPVHLQSDGLGGVTTDGQHPDRLAIEQLLADDEALTAAFNGLALHHARLQALDAATVEGSAPLTSGGFGLLLFGDKIQIVP